MPLLKRPEGCHVHNTIETWTSDHMMDYMSVYQQGRKCYPVKSASKEFYSLCVILVHPGCVVCDRTGDALW